MEKWIKKRPKIKGISKKMLQALYERSEREHEDRENFKIKKERKKMKYSNSVDDILQCHEMMRTTYSKRIAKKYAEIQGIKITTYSELNADGKKEVDELFDNHPLDNKSILDIIKRREQSND